MRAKRSCFQAMSSGPDSITISALAIESSKSVDGLMRSRARAISSAVGEFVVGQHLAPGGAPAPGRGRRLRALRLSSVVRTPPRASVRAIPGPIIPVPITQPVANLV